MPIICAYCTKIFDFFFVYIAIYRFQTRGIKQGQACAYIAIGLALVELSVVARVALADY